MIDNIELFNELARFVRPAFSDYVPIESLDVPLADTGLDSMDALTMGIYLDEIYGVDSATSKEWTFDSPKSIFALYEAHATKHPQTVNEAMEVVR